MNLLANLASFAGDFYRTTRQDSAAMSMYIASLSRLTMLSNLAPAGKRWGSGTSCLLNNPREIAGLIQVPGAPTGASASLFNFGEPTDGRKRRRLREIWAESAKYASFYPKQRL